ncbi:MAG: hypothetical protein ACJ8F2_04810 [Xanthobacteraceae bacterium]
MGRLAHLGQRAPDIVPRRTAPGPTVTPTRKFEVLQIVELDGLGNIYVADPDGGHVEKFRLLPPLTPTSATPTA